MEATYAEQQGGPDSLQAATFTWGNPYYTKVTLATIGDAPPDVAVSHLTREKNLARAGLLTEITDDMLALVGLSPSRLQRDGLGDPEGRRRSRTRSRWTPTRSSSTTTPTSATRPGC